MCSNGIPAVFKHLLYSFPCGTGMGSEVVSEVSDEESLSSTTSDLQLSLDDPMDDTSPARRKTPDSRWGLDTHYYMELLGP